MTFAKLIFVVMTSLFCTLAYALTSVTNAELSGDAESSTLRFEFSSKVKYSVNSLKNPERLYIDLEKIDKQSLEKLFSGMVLKDLIPGVNDFRIGTPFPGTTRFVLDLNKNVTLLDVSERPENHGKESVIVRWVLQTSMATTAKPDMGSSLKAEASPIALPEVKEQRNDDTTDDGKLNRLNDYKSADGKAPYNPVPQPTPSSLQKHTPGSDATATNSNTTLVELAPSHAQDGCGNTGQACDSRPVSNSHWYVLAGAGKATGSIDQKLLDNEMSALGGSGFSSSFRMPASYVLQAGYQLNNNFAIEGGYFGLTNIAYAATGGNLTGTGTASSNITGWNLTAVGILPIDNHCILCPSGFLGKLGIAYIKDSANITNGGSHGSMDGTMLNTTYGIGAQYDVTKSAFWRISADNYSVGTAYISNRYLVWTIDAGYRF